MDWEAQDDGFVAKILAQEGAKDIAVGSPVLVIVEEEVCSTLVSSSLINASHDFVLLCSLVTAVLALLWGSCGHFSLH